MFLCMYEALMIYVFLYSQAKETFSFKVTMEKKFSILNISPGGFFPSETIHSSTFWKEDDKSLNLRYIPLPHLFSAFALQYIFSRLMGGFGRNLSFDYISNCQRIPIQVQDYNNTLHVLFEPNHIHNVSSLFMCVVLFKFGK